MLHVVTLYSKNRRSIKATGRTGKMRIGSANLVTKKKAVKKYKDQKEEGKE